MGNGKHPVQPSARKIRVLVVDDSALVRRVLSDTINAQPDMEVVGTAPDPIIAQDKIGPVQPDVMTVDIEMPRMDGLTFLKLIMRDRPMPVIVISSLAQASSRAAIEAMQFGAVDVIPKPGGPFSVGDMKSSLPAKIRAAARARVRRNVAEPPPPRQASVPKPPHRASYTQAAGDRVIAIGASTGGTEALRRVLVDLPPDCPPILIVQHIPPVFSKAFADRLDTCCRIHVREAIDGDEVHPGLALIAPGNFHLTIRKTGGVYRASVGTGPVVSYQRPAADVLFTSMAEVVGRQAIGVILTGMGSDGAQGMLKMKDAGAHTIAQDEESCVVFGMPKEAIRAGAVRQVLPLDKIGAALVNLRGGRLNSQGRSKR